MEPELYILAPTMPVLVANSPPLKGFSAALAFARGRIAAPSPDQVRGDGAYLHARPRRKSALSRTVPLHLPRRLFYARIPIPMRTPF